MVTQFYWPNWWKLWPSYRKSLSMTKKEYPSLKKDLYDNTFCFGPFQCRWYST